ncbi:hypothetical protein O7598_19980 [Micromonospora sp. WMMC241]|uniref:hypothetical protein n=1 Tax=Micromonospora sp. WMMC241 TaxID=3015159 RepID=UPI0022B6DBB7|nr:hypothetical protein [Micromonospora sp. WMMC241]MCZ7438701.1 hypothetical protein [Micromonospora sp. WMMC241]
MSSRQPQWFLWVVLVSSSCTLASLLMRGPNHGSGGPVLYFAVLFGSGAMLVASVVLILLRARDRRRKPAVTELRDIS